MENSFVTIIRGLPASLESGVVSALIDYLENLRSAKSYVDTRPLMRQLDGAAQLMIPLPEYDVSDFDRNEMLKALDLLRGGNPELWAQLLHALDDRHSGLFARLKRLSPFASDYLMFLDATGDAAHLRAELDDQLAEQFLRRADAHQFPGNCYTVVVPAEALELMKFVPAVDDLPSTA